MNVLAKNFQVLAMTVGLAACRTRLNHDALEASTTVQEPGCARPRQSNPTLDIYRSVRCEGDTPRPLPTREQYNAVMHPTCALSFNQGISVMLRAATAARWRHQYPDASQVFQTAFREPPPDSNRDDLAFVAGIFSSIDAYIRTGMLPNDDLMLSLRQTLITWALETPASPTLQNMWDQLQTLLNHFLNEAPQNTNLDSERDLTVKEILCLMNEAQPTSSTPSP